MWLPPGWSWAYRLAPTRTIPSSGSLGVASSAPVAGLQSGLPLPVSMVLLSAPQSAERWVQWAA